MLTGGLLPSWTFAILTNHAFLKEKQICSTVADVYPEMRIPGPESPTPIEVLRKQLGLRLVKTGSPVDFLVIDNLERPTEN